MDDAPQGRGNGGVRTRRAMSVGSHAPPSVPDHSPTRARSSSFSAPVSPSASFSAPSPLSPMAQPNSLVAMSPEASQPSPHLSQMLAPVPVRHSMQPQTALEHSPLDSPLGTPPPTPQNSPRLSRMSPPPRALSSAPVPSLLPGPSPRGANERTPLIVSSGSINAEPMHPHDPPLEGLAEPLLSPMPSGPSSSPTTARVLAHIGDLGGAVSSAPFTGSVGTVQGMVSGGLWAASAVSSGLDNARSRSWSNLPADALSVLAGGFDMASSYLSSTPLAYAGNVSWALSSAVSGVQGAYNAFTNPQTRRASLWQMASGALNLVGAVSGGASAYYSQQHTELGSNDAGDHNAHMSTMFGAVSAVSWTLGSLASMRSTQLAPPARDHSPVPDVDPGV